MDSTPARGSKRSREPGAPATAVRTGEPGHKYTVGDRVLLLCVNDTG
eukprot:COSAG01_NODE_63293_length_280_cov_1.408840_1_plen_46_part_10